jgi:mannose-6-phosphate isomerase-like protein (cupin superfamily)
MAPFTKKNLREVEDVAVKGGVSDNQEVRFAHGELDAEQTGVSFQVVKPSKRHAFGHRHKDAEEIYVVLSGNGRARLDEEIIEVGPLDAIRVSPEVTRAFEADSDGLELLVFGPRHQGDAEVVPDFWTD